MANYPFNPIPWHGSPHDFTGNNQLGPYAEETTQRYVPGTSFMTWDGKVFKYGRVITSSVASMGIFNIGKPINISVDGTQAVVVGDRVHVLTLDADSGFAGTGVAENELAGAYITVGHGEGNEQTRCIMANTLAAQSTPTTLILDFPWNKTLSDTTAFTELMLNPYNYLGGTGDGGGASNRQACMGIAVVDSTALQYCWIQTYGPLYMTGSGAVGDASWQRSCYVTGDGAVRDGSELDIDTGYQLIGFIIDDTTGTSGMPMVMLQISI